jgi:hypothetical protein
MSRWNPNPFPPPRGWGAFLFAPAISAYAVGVSLSFMYGRWSAATEAARVQFLGWGLIASLGLIYFGGNWLQKRGPLRWRVKTPTLEIDVGNDPEERRDADA